MISKPHAALCFGTRSSTHPSTCLGRGCLGDQTFAQGSIGRKVPTKSLFEQVAPKIGTQKCSTRRGVREPLHVEFALNNRELVKAEVFEKRVFEQTAPLK